MTIPASNEGLVYVGVQSAKGTPATTLYKMYLTEFNFEPDVVQDEGEPVIGRGLDVDAVERYGFNGATIRGAMRFRPGNVGYMLKGFGLSCSTAGADPYQHTFTPLTSASSFPYLTFIDKFDASATLDVLLRDVWLNTLTITANERDALRLEFEGRALYFTTTLGSPTLNDEPAGLLTPNTAKGSLQLDSTDYKLNTLTLNMNWGEALASSLTVAELEQVIVQGRNISGNADAFLGAETGLFEDVYLGGGAVPDTAIHEGDLEAMFESGGEPLTGPLPYYVKLALAETRFLTYPLGQSGDDPVRGGLTFQVTRETTDWEIELQNDIVAYT
jgi:hypothetical protein